MFGTVPQEVPSMLDLKDIHVADLANGTRCYAKTGVPVVTESMYRLDKVSAAPEDLVTGAVVAPSAGAPIAGAADARWLMCPCG